MLEFHTEIPRGVRRLMTQPAQAARRVQRRALYATGAAVVAFVRKHFRTGGTTKRRTAVRSGNLWKSYTHGEPVETSRGMHIDAGLLKHGQRGDVSTYGRVHEGVNAAGRAVNKFEIKPKGNYPLGWDNQPGGGGRAGIVRDKGGRARTKSGRPRRDNYARSVTLRPRPGIRHRRTRQFMVAKAKRDFLREWREVLEA